jgi:hypothetical protein
MTGAVTVRLAVPADIPAIRAIEIAAGRLFAEIGMHDVAADGAHETAVLTRYISAGRAWVAESDGRVGAMRSPTSWTARHTWSR